MALLMLLMETLISVGMNKLMNEWCKEARVCINYCYSLHTLLRHERKRKDLYFHFSFYSTLYEYMAFFPFCFCCNFMKKKMFFWEKNFPMKHTCFVVHFLNYFPPFKNKIYRRLPNLLFDLIDIISLCFEPVLWFRKTKHYFSFVILLIFL